MGMTVSFTLEREAAGEMAKEKAALMAGNWRYGGVRAQFNC